MSTTVAARPHALPILPDSAQCVRSACCRNGRAGRPVLESTAEAFPMCGGNWNCSCPRRRLLGNEGVQDMGVRLGGRLFRDGGGGKDHEAWGEDDEGCVSRGHVTLRSSPRRTPTCRPKPWYWCETSGRESWPQTWGSHTHITGVNSNPDTTNNSIIEAWGDAGTPLWLREPRTLPAPPPTQTRLSRTPKETDKAPHLVVPP